MFSFFHHTLIKSLYSYMWNMVIIEPKKKLYQHGFSFFTVRDTICHSLEQIPWHGHRYMNSGSILFKRNVSEFSWSLSCILCDACVPMSLVSGHYLQPSDFVWSVCYHWFSGSIWGSEEYFSNTAIIVLWV
jgi:hypothetical protein